uniref:Wound-induced protein 1 n=1 Tax=Setaria italica TaxID=4555 RepID=K4AD58_SETIT
MTSKGSRATNKFRERRLAVSPVSGGWSYVLSTRRPWEASQLPTSDRSTGLVSSFRFVSFPSLCFEYCFSVAGQGGLPRSPAKGSIEEPARGSRLELATHHQGQGAASPRPQEAAELAALVVEESEEQRNRFLVLRLYEALNARDARRAQELLAADLEWWFHGPPARQHMMRLLTGAEKGNGGFAFTPRSVDAFGSTVIAEGADETRQLYWVHAWTVGPDGVITQLREYFNTDLTVTLLSGAASAKNAAAIAAAPPKQDAASSSSSSPSSASSSAGPKCLWQSRRADRAHKSLPGLVLAI